MKKLFLISVLFVSNIYINAQSFTDGMVTDSLNNPIENVSICFKDAKQNTMTNAEGKFSIKTSDSPKDVLICSCLGYKSVKIEMGAIKKLPLKIVLKESVFQLKEVTVKIIDGKSIVKNAIQKLDKNYISKIVKVNGNYKCLQKVNGSDNVLFKSSVNLYYRNLARHFETFNFKAYYKIYGDIIEHELYKNNKSKPNTDIFGFIFLLYIQDHPFIYNFNDYKFDYDSQFEYAGANVLKINFHPNKLDKMKEQYKGFVYIDEKTCAILYFEYKLLPNRKDYYKYSKICGGKEVNSSIKVLYTKTDSTYNLKSIIRQKEFKLYYNSDTSSYVTTDNFIANSSKASEFRAITGNKKDDRKSISSQIRRIIQESTGKTFDKSKNDLDNFILETEEEKELKKYSMELQEQSK
jgi:hypothetical protein